jgi:hypothetical protein
VSGLQTARLGLVRLLEAWRGQFSPREFAVLLDLLARWIETERLKGGLASLTRELRVRRSRSIVRSGAGSLRGCQRGGLRAATSWRSRSNSSRSIGTPSEEGMPRGCQAPADRTGKASPHCMRCLSSRSLAVAVSCTSSVAISHGVSGTENARRYLIRGRRRRGGGPSASRSIRNCSAAS